jgi:NAD(P)-dependent dehydrogenase (short-subunit alcohol dehydrogenase family)
MAATAPVCLITGSATGIGAACARQFAAQGWHVALSHLDDSTFAEARTLADDCEAAGAQVLLQTLDVRDETACQSYVASVLDRFGRIDALVNSAGTTRFIPHTDLDALGDDEFHRTYDVNVVGAYRMVRACAAALKASGGGILNISSIGGVLGRGSSMAYAASKGALNTLTLALARSLAPQVRVNAIAPGFVDGGLPGRVLEKAQYAQVMASQTAAAVLQRVSQPDEVAALAWFVTTQAPAMTGNVLVMDNGLHLNAG